jgi:single-strand DNA-binding protein
MSVCKVILIGHLGHDPESKQAESGVAVCSFSLATKRTFKDKQGKRVDETEWHRVVAFGRTAEVCAQYLKKGKQVYIEGRLHTQKWQDKDGKDQWTTEVIVDQMKMLSGQSGSPAGDERAPDVPF